MVRKKIKVLVVDDSRLYREVLCKGISSEPLIEVVASACDPYEARDKILRYNPDVITCDIEMPKMDGIEFVKKLMPQYPLPVIMVSTVSNAVFEAMNAGAVDFVVKPDINSPNGVKEFIYEIIAKIKAAAQAKIPALQVENKAFTGQRILRNLKYNDNSIVVAIGASTGGTEAILKILRQLPENMPGIIIAQHIPPVFSRMLAERLNVLCALTVKEAVSGDIVEQGKVYIAPGDMHMKIKKIDNRYKIECFKGEKVNGHCPSVDVLFESVAKEAGKDALGVILTGMGYDGAKGLLAMKRKGAKTVGQDERTSVVYGMPKVAMELGAVEKQVPIDRISYALIDMLGMQQDK